LIILFITKNSQVKYDRFIYFSIYLFFLSCDEILKHFSYWFVWYAIGGKIGEERKTTAVSIIDRYEGKKTSH